jgi:hypothetical protein
MLFVLPKWATVTATLAVVAFGLARGGLAVRIVASLTLLSLSWTSLHHYVYGRHVGVDLALDGAMAAVVTGLALRSKRYWTLAAASVWWVTLATEIAQAVAPVDAWAYGTAELTWWYLSLACLAAGAWRAPPRQRGEESAAA